MKGCRYNTCSICGFASDCEIYKAYETQKDINKQYVNKNVYAIHIKNVKEYGV